MVRLRIKPWSSYSRLFSLSVVLPDVVKPRRLHTTSLATEDGGRLPPVELSVYEEAFVALTIEATLHVGSHDTVEPVRLLLTSLLTEDGGRLPLVELARSRRRSCRHTVLASKYMSSNVEGNGDGAEKYREI